MCGVCPYYNRCMYIHDPRIKNKNYNIMRYSKKKYRKPRYYIYNDIWLWPFDISNSINGIKYYNISKALANYYFEYAILYSIWYNFIDICNNKYNYINKYTNKSRLPVFINITL
jgi:hypothetical protein